MGVWNVHWRLDLTHDGVKRGVYTERFLDDVVVEGKLAERLVGEGPEVLSENTLLFRIEVLTVKSSASSPMPKSDCNLHNIRSRSQVQENPCRSSH